MKRFLSAAIVVGMLMQPAACLAEATVSAETMQTAAETTPAPVAEKTEEQPATDAPETNAPSTDAPVDNVPETNVPSTDVPSTDVPATNAPSTDVPETDAPATDVPSTDAPSTDVPATDAPTTDAPSTDAPSTDAPATDAPSTDAPSTDAPATDAPTSTPAAGPAVLPMESEIPEDAQAWMLAEGGRACGSLAELVAYAAENTEIRLLLPEVMEIKDAPLAHLSSLKLMADEDAFEDGEYRVVISEESPETTEAPVELDPAEWAELEEDATANLFVWVVKVEPDVSPEPSQPPEESASIAVEADDYRAAQWSPVHPTFALSGIPEGKSWVYAAVIYDERIVVLSDNLYTAEEEGVYTVRFVILDEYGDIVDASEKYTLWLDHTQPEVSVTIDSEKDYTMYIDLADSMSGVQALSLDGGVNWMELNGESADAYTVCGKMTLEAGMVQVRDAAGNLWVSSESYELTKIPKDNFGGGWGGGSGGGGDSKPAKQHAKAEPDSKASEAEYDALAMELPEEPMRVLTIDGQELSLTLELTNAEGFEIPEEYQPTFTAELTAWTVEEEPLDDEEEPQVVDRPMDTLILTAVPEENLGDRFEYRWKFNGEVYRLLANSGVRYLALQIGDDMAVFPTEGFVGGTKYTELKMLGVSTKKFDYTVAMTFNLDPDHIPALSENDFSESCDIAVMTEVEDMKYVLTAEQKGEMYYYNVCLGPKTMMDVPYGAYGALEAAEELK